MDSYCLLVLDDVQIHRWPLLSGLDGIGPFMHIDVASSVDQAQQLLADRAYDAVLCDRMVSQSCGHQLLKWMRARPNYRSVPFVMVSSWSVNEEIGSAFCEHNVNDDVVKPFHSDAAFPKVAAASRRTGRRRTRLS